MTYNILFQVLTQDNEWIDEEYKTRYFSAMLDSLEQTDTDEILQTGYNGAGWYVEFKTFNYLDLVLQYIFKDLHKFMIDSRYNVVIETNTETPEWVKDLYKFNEDEDE